MKTTKVEVHQHEQANPIVIEDVRNAYTKGQLYCVMQNDGTTYKFPLMGIFRIKEICAPAAK